MRKEISQKDILPISWQCIFTCAYFNHHHRWIARTRRQNSQHSTNAKTRFSALIVNSHLSLFWNRSLCVFFFSSIWRFNDEVWCLFFLRANFMERNMYHLYTTTTTTMQITKPTYLSQKGNNKKVYLKLIIGVKSAALQWLRHWHLFFVVVGIVGQCGKDELESLNRKWNDLYFVLLENWPWSRTDAPDKIPTFIIINTMFKMRVCCALFDACFWLFLVFFLLYHWLCCCSTYLIWIVTFLWMI